MRQRARVCVSPNTTGSLVWEIHHKYERGHHTAAGPAGGEVGEEKERTRAREERREISKTKNK